MARPITDEELQLKKRARRRLVGAIVLVSVLAVVLPMVLDSEPRRSGQNVDIQIPSPDAGEFKPRSPAAAPKAKAAPESVAKIDPPVAVPEPTPSAGAANSSSSRETASESASARTGDRPPDTDSAKPPAQSAAAAKADGKGPVTAKTEAKAASAAKGEAKGAAADKSKAKAPAADKGESKSAAAAQTEDTSSGSYVVQVAALSDAGKARELEKRMASAGVKTYTETVNTQVGEVTRVRAGPYATRDAAEKARAQLKRAGLEGKIVPRGP